MDLNAWLDGTRLVVCVGSGGVGKTTTAAAIGLWAAARGRRAMVLTIDPAKRLANSLGLDAMGGEPTRIDLSALGDGAVAPGGELWAMMLDSRSTFDDLIARVAPSEESRERILANHVYRHMADAFAGSQDYMATEKLHDLAQSGRWDLLVLDTPPVKNALDFLESPGRVVRFLDERVLGWLLAPYDKDAVWSARLLAGTTNLVYRLLGMVFGRDFLDDLAAFLQDFQGLYDGFRTRHTAVLELMRRPDTQFVTVCAPTESSADVARYFQAELAQRGLGRAGVVVNQVHRTALDDDEVPETLRALAARVAGDMPEGTVDRVMARLGRAHARLRALVQAEQARAASVREAAGKVGFYQQVPRFTRDVHDLPALLRIGEAIFAVPAEAA